MVVANAAYTLMVNNPPQAEFQADAIARVMAGNMERRIDGKRRQELEVHLQKLAGIQLYILADHDHQVEQDLYEGGVSASGMGGSAAGGSGFILYLASRCRSISTPSTQAAD